MVKYKRYLVPYETISEYVTLGLYDFLVSLDSKEKLYFPSTLTVIDSVLDVEG